MYKIEKIKTSMHVYCLQGCKPTNDINSAQMQWKNFNCWSGFF